MFCLRFKKPDFNFFPGFVLCIFRDVRNPSFCDVHAVPGNGKCIRYANKYVRGYCCDGQPYGN